MAEAELLKARQEPLLLLSAKYPEHEFRGIGGAAPAHHGEDQAGEIGMIEVGDAAPSPPLRLLRLLRLIFSITHVASRRVYGCRPRDTTALRTVSPELHDECRERSRVFRIIRGHARSPHAQQN